MKSNSRYLLILACSQRKKTGPGLLPATERYDGPSYRVLNKLRREGKYPSDLDLIIISAKFGLLQPTSLIPDYNQRMTRERVRELGQLILTNLDKYLSQRTYEAILVSAGENYRMALAQSNELRRMSAVIQYTQGRIGAQLSQLKHWLTEINNKSQ